MLELVPLQGLDVVYRGFKTLDAKVQQAGEEGLMLAGLYLFTLSQGLVPVDTGALKASGQVRKVGRGMACVVFIVYSVDYALFVHEMVHIGRRNGKIPKFVEVPLRANYQTLIAIVRNHIMKSIT